MDFNRLKIASKLWLFIGLILTLLIGIAGVGLARSGNILGEGRATTTRGLQDGAGGNALEWFDGNQCGPQPRHDCQQ